MLAIKPISIIHLLLLSVVPFCLTANIMLANNICDLKHDIAVNRYTLAYYIQKHSTKLFAAIYYITYLSVIVMVAIKQISPVSLLLLLTLIPVQKNINIFMNKQVKEETFIAAIKNFVLIIIVHSILLFVGAFIPIWG